MAYRNTNNFPSQVVPDVEKISYDYGLKVAQAIESEWFDRNEDGNIRGNGRFYSNKNNFHNLRLYARGEQSVQKYKNELSINGDLSFLNLDWKPVPVIPKFVDIVVNGLNDRLFKVNAFAEDAMSAEKRDEFQKKIEGEMIARPLFQQIEEDFELNVFQTAEDELPDL